MPAIDLDEPFELEDFHHYRLLEGLDDIGITLRHDSEITAYESAPPHLAPRRPSRQPTPNWRQQTSVYAGLLTPVRRVMTSGFAASHRCMDVRLRSRRRIGSPSTTTASSPLHHLARARGLRGHDASQRLRHRTLARVHDRVYRIVGTPASWKGDLARGVLGRRHACRGVASISGGALGAAWTAHGRSLEITCPRWRRAQHDGLVVHESTSARASATSRVVDSIPVTTVERTIFDLAAVCSRFTVDLAIDNALRRELTTVDESVRDAPTCRRARTRRARELLARTCSQIAMPSYTPTESEREQMLLRVLREHGLPEPERQFSIYDDAGNFARAA